DMRATVDQVHEVAERVDKATAGIGAAVEDKATVAQLKEIVREAWTREEGHLARLQKLCESKVSAGDFASLAAVAEGKASLADVDAAVQAAGAEAFADVGLRPAAPEPG
ncbi:unnamed protein product, partial [Polarella glacialis]